MTTLGTEELRGRLDVATDVARLAGKLTLEWFRTSGLEVDTKADGTPVTMADKAAERLIREHLTRRFPDDGIVGEEEDDVAGTSGLRWVIDPIDGTKAFTHGVPLYSTLLALLDGDGHPVLGVVDLPALGETASAARGVGCWLTRAGGAPERTTVSTTDVIGGSWAMTSGLTPWDLAAVERLKAAGVHLRTWGDAYGYVLVATGRADAMIDPIAELWDLAAPAVVVTEAGGRFTATDGTPGPAAGSGIGSNGRVHDALIDLLGG
ncbi:MAG: inositol monophosphatase family protein [Actinomycetota bacterium]|nr:inositol monophosphatase family protein [Actinomycetota bacterium]